jgi:RNA polymerase sigma-54 factor
MALSVKLELRQGQQLVMTPQLQQAIRLLQLSNLELMEFIETELERNPLLERDENTENPVCEDTETPELTKPEEPSAVPTDDNWLDLAKPADPESGFDSDYENVFTDTAPADLGPNQSGLGWASLRQRSSGMDDDVNIEAFVANDVTLRQHLSEQLPLVLKEPAERIIGQYLIDMLDDAGYLPADLGALTNKLGAPPELIERAIVSLQTLDPPGVFARSLAECLALQLKEQNRYDTVIGSFLENLHLLASHNLSGLRKVVGVEMEELAEIITEVKRLDPKPGLKFGSVQMQPVVPDVLVRPAPDGSWIVELNTDTLPRVLVNRTYLARVSKTASSHDDHNYLVECLQTANWLVKSLDQRARTILKVAEEIVRQQDGFFIYGVQYLRPLNLKTVADAISMHESTVSRVTSNKYMATSRGIFELKYFFTSAIACAGEGEAHSSESVRHRIRQMIDGETPASVLSDDKIVEKLKTDGIDIARRTVAKYREAMRIPSSVQRRRDKRLSECLGRLAQA